MVSSQGVGGFQQTGQGGGDIRFQGLGRQVQDAQVDQIRLARRVDLLEILPGLLEDQRGEERVAVAVVAEAAGLAQQAADHVAVVDALLAGTDQARHLENTARLVVNLQVPFVDMHIHILPNQAGGHGVGVVLHADQAGTGDAHALVGVGDQLRGGQRAHDRQFLGQPGLAGLIAPRQDTLHKGFVVGQRGEVPAAAQEQVLFQGAFQPAIAAFHVAVLLGRAPVRGARLHPVVVEQLQIALRVGAPAMFPSPLLRLGGRWRRCCCPSGDTAARRPTLAACSAPRSRMAFSDSDCATRPHSQFE